MSEDQKSNEKRVLKIRLGEEYKPVVEDYTRAKESYFRGIYEKGIRIVKDIVDDRNIENQIDSEDNYYNNIIAFVGDRGMGKTSCMKSFEKLLTANNKFFSMGFKEGESSSYNESSSKFYSMGTIDPSLFDKQNNLLEVVIAKMFERFKEAMENNQNCNNRNENNRRELIKQFSTIHENLKSLYSEEKSKDECDDIDELIKKAESIKLKENIANLVQNFLSFIGRGEDVKFLILIDDIDLNTEHAYKMAEQIRKYLIIPKVVILMAVKINQLSDAVEQNLIKANKELLKQERIDHQEIAVMTEKYLEKLIPVDRRLYLPDLNDLEIKIPLEIEDGNFKAETVEFGVRELICTRTGMYFQKYEQRPNYIVPKNFRELIDLITMLYKMEPVRRTAKSICMEILQSGFVPASASKLQYKWEEKDFDKKYLFVNDLIDFEEEELENICTWGAGESEEIGSNLKYFTDQILRKSDEDKKETDENKDQKKVEKILSFSGSFDQLKQAVKDIKKEKQNRDKEITRQKQLATFKDYFLNSWCNYHLKREHNEIIKGFMSMTVSEKNKYIIRRLDELFKLTERDNKNDNRGNKKVRDAYKDILDHDNTSINISLGDVLFVLERCEKIATEYIEIQFIFAIKTIYSILMNQYKKEELMENDYDLSNKKAYSRYDRLIGGSIHLSKVNPILGDDNGYQDEKIIDYEKLCEKKNTLEGKFIALFIKRFGLEKLEDNYYLDQEAYYDAKRLLKNPERVGINIFSGLLNIANIGILEKNKILDGELLETIKPYAKNPVYFGNIEMIENLMSYDIKNKIREELIAEKKEEKQKEEKQKEEKQKKEEQKEEKQNEKEKKEEKKMIAGKYWIKYLEKMREYRLDSSIVTVTFRNNGLFRVLDEIIKNENGTAALEKTINEFLKDKDLLVEEMRKNKDNFKDAKSLFERYEVQLEVLDISNFEFIKENISRYRTKEELIYDIDKGKCSKKVDDSEYDEVLEQLNNKFIANNKKIELTERRTIKQKGILDKRILQIKKINKICQEKVEKYKDGSSELPKLGKRLVGKENMMPRLKEFRKKADELDKIRKEMATKLDEVDRLKDQTNNTKTNLENLERRMKEVENRNSYTSKKMTEINSNLNLLEKQREEIDYFILENENVKEKKERELEQIIQEKNKSTLLLNQNSDEVHKIEEFMEFMDKENELKKLFNKSVYELNCISDSIIKSKKINSKQEKTIISEFINNIVNQIGYISFDDTSNIHTPLRNPSIRNHDVEIIKRITSKLNDEKMVEENEIRILFESISNLKKNVNGFGRVYSERYIGKTDEEQIEGLESDRERCIRDIEKIEKVLDELNQVICKKQQEIKKIEEKIVLKKRDLGRNLERQKIVIDEKESIDKEKKELGREGTNLEEAIAIRRGAERTERNVLIVKEVELKRFRRDIDKLQEDFTKYKIELPKMIDDFDDVLTNGTIKKETIEAINIEILGLRQKISKLEDNLIEVMKQLKSNQSIINFQRKQMIINCETINNLIEIQEKENKELLEEEAKCLKSIKVASRKEIVKKLSNNEVFVFKKLKNMIEQKINEAQQLEDDIELQLIEVELITQG